MRIINKIPWSSILLLISNLFFQALYVLIVVGILAYLIKYIDALVHNKPVESPLQLALAATALGGFILIVAFYEREGDYEQKLKKELKRVAKFFLAAAVSFIIAYLLLFVIQSLNSPTLGPLDWFLGVFTAASMVSAAIFFAQALVELISILRNL